MGKVMRGSKVACIRLEEMYDVSENWNSLQVHLVRDAFGRFVCAIIHLFK